MTSGVELVPFPERVGAIQMARAFLCMAVVAATEFGADVVDVQRRDDLVVVSIGYQDLSTGADVCAVAQPEAARSGLHDALVDGVYFAAVLASTGGTSSSLLPLVLLRIVLVTLLASFTSGLAMAGWHSLLLIAVVRAGWVSGSEPGWLRELALVVASYLAVAMATAAAGRLNERALQDTQNATGTLLELGSKLEGCRTVHDVTMVAAAHLGQWAGTNRATVPVRHESACGAAPRDVGDAVDDVGGVSPQWTGAADLPGPSGRSR